MIPDALGMNTEFLKHLSCNKISANGRIAYVTEWNVILLEARTLCVDRSRGRRKVPVYVCFLHTNAECTA